MFQELAASVSGTFFLSWILQVITIPAVVHRPKNPPSTYSDFTSISSTYTCRIAQHHLSKNSWQKTLELLIMSLLKLRTSRHDIPPSHLNQHIPYTAFIVSRSIVLSQSPRKEGMFGSIYFLSVLLGSLVSHAYPHTILDIYSLVLSITPAVSKIPGTCHCDFLWCKRWCARSTFKHRRKQGLHGSNLSRSSTLS